MTAVAAAPPTPDRTRWRSVVITGLQGAIVAIYMCLVGIVPTFESRPLITGVLALGESFIIGTLLVIGYLAARRSDGSRAARVLAGALAGLITGAALSLLMLVAPAVNLRSIFLHSSPELFSVLTLGRGLDAFYLPAVGGVVIGGIGAAIALLPRPVQRSIAAGIVSLIALGLFAGLLRTPTLASPLAWLGRLVFASEGLTLFGAVVTLAGA